jgi:hypothetical protein
VRLHPDRVDHRVRASSVSELADRLGDVVVLVEVEDFDVVAARHLEPFAHEVDGDHARAVMARDA